MNALFTYELMWLSYVQGMISALSSRSRKAVSDVAPENSEISLLRSIFLLRIQINISIVVIMIVSCFIITLFTNTSTTRDFLNKSNLNYIVTVLIKAVVYKMKFDFDYLFHCFPIQPKQLNEF